MIACHFKVVESVCVFFLKKPRAKHNITLGFERNCRLIANCCFFFYFDPIGTGRLFFFFYRIETVRFRIRKGIFVYLAEPREQFRRTYTSHEAIGNNLASRRLGGKIAAKFLSFDDKLLVEEEDKREEIRARRFN